MKLVLLSGGSGKRLWPLSNDSRSKQFLKVLPSEENQLQSMVQRVWSQLCKLSLNDSAVIATSKAQVEMIQSQLDENISIVVEPERRDTFPAIALSAVYLYDVLGIKGDEVIGVLPVDPFVEDTFFSKLLELENILKETNAELALMGVKPTFPSEKYGYIVPDLKETANNIIQVSHFKEKPSVEEASELLKQNALWNCGVFAFRLHRLITWLEEKGLPTNYTELLENYSLLPKISFDYEIVEKSTNIVALPYDGDWKDLGTWNTLTEEMGVSILGKASKSHDSENTHIINELDIPINVLGLNNIIVAASPDGILVTDKDASPRVKELVGNFEQRPMYEERRWGWYRVLEHTKYDNGTEVLTKRINITAGSNLSYHYHNHRKEVWTVVKGEGVLLLNEEFKVIRPGDVVEIPVGMYHAVKAVTELEFIEVQSGSPLVEEDNHRILLTWDEIENRGYALRR